MAVAKLNQHFNEVNMNGIKIKNLIGIFLIVAGLLWLFENFDIITLDYPIRKIIFSWYTLAIIFGSIIISKNHRSIWGYFLIIIGAIGIIKHFPFLPFVSFLTFSNLWPIILIILGTLMILNMNSKKNYHVKFQHYEKVDSSNDELINENVQFTSIKKNIINDNFKGGKINVAFGELKLDLSQAKLYEDENILDVNIMFGSLVLRVPTDWKIYSNLSATFGGIDDKRVTSLINSQSKSVLNIKGSVAFGGCEITY